MGGRGSGKTTILSLINWAISKDEEISKEINTLIKTNLKSATLNITFKDNNERKITLSKSNGSSPVIKNDKDESITIEDFRKNFSIDFYPAGSIEEIGINPKQRLKIFDDYDLPPIL
jgi:hypothetical protein